MLSPSPHQHQHEVHRAASMKWNDVQHMRLGHAVERERSACSETVTRRLSSDRVVSSHGGSVKLSVRTSMYGSPCDEYESPLMNARSSTVRAPAPAPAPAAALA